MRLSTVLFAGLTFNLLACSIPVQETFDGASDPRTNYGRLVKRVDDKGNGKAIDPTTSAAQDVDGDDAEEDDEDTNTPPGKINARAKYITLRSQRFRGPVYPSAPNLEGRKPDTEVEDILERYEGLHGIWLMKKAEPSLVEEKLAGEERVDSK